MRASAVKEGSTRGFEQFDAKSFGGDCHFDLTLKLVEVGDLLMDF